jgi:hypothetical protein
VVVLAITPAVDPSGIRLIAECRTPIGPWRAEGVGGNVVHAAGQLIARASEDRLTVAFREVVAT